MTDHLIVECGGLIEAVLNESSENGRLKFRGKFQEANQVNKNKRLYPYEVLDENLKRLGENITNRTLLGELDHPDNSIVHLDKASHVVTKLWWENDILMGEGEVLNTAHGKILRSLLEFDIPVGISSRGIGNGTTNNEGVLVIGESYKLITFDVVADPSTLKAFQKVVQNTTKQESMLEGPLNDDSDIKTESNSINTIDPDVLISLFNGMLDQGKKEKLNSIFNTSEDK